MHDAPKCSRCGRGRTRIIAESVSPPGAIVRCEQCGHSTLAASTRKADARRPGQLPPADGDSRRIERLVNSVILDRYRGCHVLAAERVDDAWRVVVRTQAGGFVRFEVGAGSLAAMRATIEQALAAAAP
jgi:hypothetical protein